MDHWGADGCWQTLSKVISIFLRCCGRSNISSKTSPWSNGRKWLSPPGWIPLSAVGWWGVGGQSKLIQKARIQSLTIEKENPGNGAGVMVTICSHCLPRPGRGVSNALRSPVESFDVKRDKCSAATPPPWFFSWILSLVNFPFQVEVIWCSCFWRVKETRRYDSILKGGERLVRLLSPLQGCFRELSNGIVYIFCLFDDCLKLCVIKYNDIYLVFQRVQANENPTTIHWHAICQILLRGAGPFECVLPSLNFYCFLKESPIYLFCFPPTFLSFFSNTNDNHIRT